ncbi:MAG: hypothetical protein N4A46_09975 [Schleiferiaceae bacterium]|jgi:hypothetical protein|nr:hypothetical protein [Schleiferiaceae bacterium]
MNSKVILAINVALSIIAIFLVFKIYRLIMEPIEFDKLRDSRFEDVKTSLINIREAQLAYREEIGGFCPDLDVLVAFVDTGSLTIIERKDTSFMAYNKVYQKDMMKDSVIVRILGTETVKKNRFGADFDVNSILYIPHSNNEKFELGAGILERNGVKVPVFEAKAGDKSILYGVEERFVPYIDENHSLIVGSLTEPTIGGNWQ